MIIKKFQAPTEAEAVLMAKEEMGSSAVVVNVKTVKHRLPDLFGNVLLEALTD